MWCGFADIQCTKIHFLKIRDKKIKMQKDRYKECFTVNSVNMGVSRKYKKIARNKDGFGEIDGNFICKNMIIYKNI